MIKLADRLKEVRRAAKLTQVDVSNKTGINRATLANWEVGRTEPDANTLTLLAEVYNVSLDYLFCKTNDPRTIKQINAESQTRISTALSESDTDLIQFWQELKQREDLFLLFKQARHLDDEDIRKVIKIIKVIEDEESAGNRHD